MASSTILSIGSFRSLFSGDPSLVVCCVSFLFSSEVFKHQVSKQFFLVFLFLHRGGSSLSFRNFRNSENDIVAVPIALVEIVPCTGFVPATEGCAVDPLGFLVHEHHSVSLIHVPASLVGSIS